ncbi:hypothetical protein WDU94_005552, partial [Cyamophila willieti]
MSWDGTLGSITDDDLFDSRYNDGQRIVVGNIPIDVREEELEDLFAPFGKVLEVIIFAKALTGPQSRCNHAYITLETADRVQQVLDQRPIYYPKDPKDPNRFKLTVKRKEKRSAESKSTSDSNKSLERKSGVTQNGKSSESKEPNKKDGTTQNGKFSESKDSNKKDGTTQNGKSTKPKDGVTEKGEKEKELDAKEKLSKEGGEFCQFEGMQHVCKELKISGREVYDKLAALSSLEDQ